MAIGISSWEGDAADSICINCTGPEAAYACRLSDVRLDADDARMRLRCITEIAKTRGHASCTAARRSLTPCSGDEVVLAPATPTPLAPATASDDVTLQEPTDPTQAEDRAASGADAEPSQAASEEASPVQSALKSAGKTLNAAGQAVSNTAKKSWSCMTSFFSDC